MKRLIFLPPQDIGDATDTHCMHCPRSNGLHERCDLLLKEQEWDEEGDMLRLPECIAAEGQPAP